METDAASSLLSMTGLFETKRVGASLVNIVAILPIFIYTDVLMPQSFFRFSLLFLCCLFAACGKQNDGLLRLAPDPDETGTSSYIAEDPQGPIPEPSLPPELFAAMESTVPPPAISGNTPEEPGHSPADAQGAATESLPPPLPYTVQVVSPDAPALEGAFLGASQLQLLQNNPPTSVMGLSQRMRRDLEIAHDVLHSFGYYSGKASGKISGQKKAETAQEAEKEPRNGTPENNGKPAPSGPLVVTISFEPGLQYTIGKTRVSVTEPERLQPDPTRGRFTPPVTSLAELGVKEGDPALADNVLNAVSAVRENFRDRGYPFASIASSRYIVDHGSQSLEADIVVDSGPLVHMNGLVVKGESPVKKRYLDALTTWRTDQPWNQSRVERFRNSLRQSGLFSSAELSPAENDDENGRRAVVAELEEAPPRTVSGALKFDTDFGPGVQGSWIHRNITGRGDRLRIEMPLWADLQELVASYRLPFFLRNDQDFTARAAYRKEDTDAYKLTAYLASAGLERRFSRLWTGAIALHLEGGDLEDPDETRTRYRLMGVPMTLSYSNANSLLDATRGFRLNLAVAPYSGQFHDNFSVIQTRVEGQAFLPVIGENSLVLAFRGMYGMIADTKAQDVPASLRFYTGGGGSVRGYAFQSLGPRNDSNDPLGGASVVEVSAEARARFNDTWGMVAFLDGGMAYEDAVADITSNSLRWGAGVGLRFHTAIGPVRLDLAVPLNKRADDDSMQIYFSIGQSF